MSEFENLYAIIMRRKAQPQEGSYTCYLFRQGLDKILKKLGEECAETIIAAKNNNRDELIGELGDLAFHAAMLMAEQGITPEDIAGELRKRAQKTGNLKQSHKVDKNS